MRSAVHRSTRDRVFPLNAEGGRGRYICECCEAPVHLVRGTPFHFAHDKYRANPNCENYVWSEYRYSGRPSIPRASSEMDPDEVSYLAFEMSLEGPRLVVFLPPATLSGSGIIEIIAPAAWQIPVGHLTRGLRFSFPLSGGAWSIRASDDVCEEYISRLSLGRHSLEMDRNLFSASSETGRRIEPLEPIMLGGSVWWVGRSDIRTHSDVPRNVDLQYICVDHGWHVFQVTLPDLASESEMALLAQWLQRRIQPRRARVWVETPFPRARHPDGVYVFAISDGPVQLRADRPVSIEVIDATGTPLLVAESVSETNLPTVPVGELEVRADGVRVGRCRFLSDVPSAVWSACVEFSDHSTLDFVELQLKVDEAARGGAASLSGRLRWRPSILKTCLTTSCALGTNTAIEADFTIAPGQSINFDKLGVARWLAQPVISAQTTAIESLPRVELFRWLNSVGIGGVNTPGRLRLHASQQSQKRFPELRRLSRLSWPAMMKAQVDAAQRVLASFQ